MPLKSSAGSDQDAGLLNKHPDGFKYLVDSAADGIIVQQDGYVVYANPKAMAQFGAITLSQINDRPLSDFVAPDDRPDMIAYRRQLMDGGGFCGPQTFRRKRLDGTYVELAVVAAKTTWQGRPALLGILRSAIQRERIQISLENSDMLRDRLMSTSDRSLWETDAAHRFAYVSEEISISGLPPESFIGKTL